MLEHPRRRRRKERDRKAETLRPNDLWQVGELITSQEAKNEEIVWLFLIVLLVVTLSVLAQGSRRLRLVRSIPMPGFEGGDFDHFEADLKGNRLFLAAEDHKTVEVFNLRTGKRLRSNRGSRKPPRYCLRPDSNRLIVTVGEVGSRWRM